MLKHIGKHNDKKIVLLWREVPGEDHMCLVSYSDLLPRIYHDAVMSVLESAAGQQAQNLSDALHRNYMPDGKNCLEALHVNGLIKKVPTNQVMVTPNNTSSVRLDELNTILNEMAKGEEATRKLADLDKQKGITGKAGSGRTSAADVGERSAPAASVADILSDTDLAQQRIRQAETMKADAERLMREADRLLQEAAELNPKPNAKKTTKKSATKTQKN